MLIVRGCSGSLSVFGFHVVFISASHSQLSVVICGSSAAWLRSHISVVVCALISWTWCVWALRLLSSFVICSIIVPVLSVVFLVLVWVLLCAKLLNVGVCCLLPYWLWYGWFWYQHCWCIGPMFNVPSA